MESRHGEASGLGSRKKRVRKFTPSDRAQHRILERKRREAFNDRMLELARLLPGIASVRQLSKHIIVDESIRQLETERKGRATLIAGVKALMVERDYLLQELGSMVDIRNRGRACSWAPRVLDSRVLEMVRDEQEPSPAFKGTLGNGEGYDEEDEGEDSDTHAGHRYGDDGTLPAWTPPFSNSEVQIASLQTPVRNPTVDGLILNHAPFHPMTNPDDLSYLFTATTSTSEAPLEPVPPEPLELWPILDDPPLGADVGRIGEMPWPTELAASSHIPNLTTSYIPDQSHFNIGRMEHSDVPARISQIPGGHKLSARMRWLT